MGLGLTTWCSAGEWNGGSATVRVTHGGGKLMVVSGIEDWARGDGVLSYDGMGWDVLGTGTCTMRWDGMCSALAQVRWGGMGYRIGDSMHVLYDVNCGMRYSMVCWMDYNLCDRG